MDRRERLEKAQLLQAKFRDKQRRLREAARLKSEFRKRWEAKQAEMENPKGKPTSPTAGLTRNPTGEVSGEVPEVAEGKLTRPTAALTRNPPPGDKELAQKQTPPTPRVAIKKKVSQNFETTPSRQKTESEKSAGTQPPPGWRSKLSKRRRAE